MRQSEWFKDAIVYQIYPRSFCDSNQDGIGDLNGIISKLDYLKDLGITCIWLSPVYLSPMDDNGYDIADYKKIHPMFGTMEDFKRLLQEVHQRKMKLIMDLVANHTSDEHEWFINSRSSDKNPYRDYYIWKKGRKNKAPNNWSGFFGEKAWEYDATTDAYYLHLFGKKQPDVNWENPKVREAYKTIMRFYLDMGVDGFRCDVINLISKDPSFKNGRNPLILTGKKYFINGPKLHDYLKEIHQDVLSNYDCMTVGETVFTNLEDIKKLTGASQKELSMVFNFDHTSVDNYFGVKWLMRKFSLRRFKKIIDHYQIGLQNEGWNSLFYENHDQRRSVGRFNTSDDLYRIESAKLLATAMYFLKGTPFIYQGQEIGMTNMQVSSIDEFVDLETHNVRKVMEKLPLSKKYIERSIKNGSRDNARIPMQWDDSCFAGFSTVKPWLKVNENKSFINVQSSLKDEHSILSYYKKLIALHKELPIVKEGVYRDLLPASTTIFAYERSIEKQKLLVICNFSAKEIKCDLLKRYSSFNKKLLLNNYECDERKLKPYQCKVYLLEK